MVNVAFSVMRKGAAYVNMRVTIAIRELSALELSADGEEDECPLA